MAGTYYVSPIGTATWVNCEGVTALNGNNYCSLAIANINAVAGDTIYLRGGTYTNQVRAIEPHHSGTSEDNRITYSNYSGETVLITASGYGIYINQRSYITINGINFFALQRNMGIFSGSYNIISHCNFNERSTLAIWTGSAKISSNSRYNKVLNCTFTRWARGEFADHKGTLLDIGNDLIPGDDSSHNLVENCVFAYGGHHTLGVYAQYNVIRNNYIHNESWNFEGYRGAISAGKNAGKCLYEGNRFGFSKTDGIAVRSHNNIFRFNLFYHNGRGGIQLVSYPLKGYLADENHIYNNVFYSNGHQATYSGFQGGMYFANWKMLSPKRSVVKNNIFFNNRAGAITYDGPIDPQIIISNWEQNSVDPGFVDLTGTSPDVPTLPDLHLKVDSFAKDQGAWLTTISSPKANGNTFTVDDPWYFMDGWGVVEGDLIQLAGQEVRARIVSINYDTKTITVDRALNFTTGQGVSLAYDSSSPDLGASEIVTNSNMIEGNP